MDLKLPSSFKGTLRGLSIAERFAAQSMPEPNTGCWLWLGSLNRKGYGGSFQISRINGLKIEENHGANAELAIEK
jgi:hypothetical protein